MEGRVLESLLLLISDFIHKMYLSDCRAARKFIKRHPKGVKYMRYLLDSCLILFVGVAVSTLIYVQNSKTAAPITGRMRAVAYSSEQLDVISKFEKSIVSTTVSDAYFKYK